MAMTTMRMDLPEKIVRGGDAMPYTMGLGAPSYLKGLEIVEGFEIRGIRIGKGRFQYGPDLIEMGLHEDADRTSPKHHLASLCVLPEDDIVFDIVNATAETRTFQGVLLVEHAEVIGQTKPAAIAAPLPALAEEEEDEEEPPYVAPAPAHAVTTVPLRAVQPLLTSRRGATIPGFKPAVGRAAVVARALPRNLGTGASAAPGVVPRAPDPNAPKVHHAGVPRSPGIPIDRLGRGLPTQHVVARVRDLRLGVNQFAVLLSRRQMQLMEKLVCNSYVSPVEKQELRGPVRRALLGQDEPDPVLEDGFLNGHAEDDDVASGEAEA